MIVAERIEAYLHRLEAAPKGVLRDMEAEGERRGFPIIGPLVGRLCEQWTRAIDGRTVFEMGSGFGYSTAWFARAVGEAGRVVHTDGSRELSAQARAWLERAGLADRVEFLVGDAVELLRERAGTWDVVFIDIDKEQYPQAWEVARHRVRQGGLIVTDNALWQGKVADAKARDKATKGVREYLRLAMEDSGFLTTVMPVRDGVAISLRL